MEAVPASGPYYWESLDSDKDDLGQKAEEADMETSLTDKYFVVSIKIKKLRKVEKDRKL